MKHMKKIASLLLALVMLLSLATTAFAADDYSITVKNSNTAISINGNTYKAYKLFDVLYNSDKTAYNYTIADEFKDFEYTVGETTYKGESLIAYISEQKDNSDALNAFAEAALKYATDNSIDAAGSATAANETATISLTEPGYYLVAGVVKTTDSKKETITAACSLTTADPTATVKVKADAPSVDKNIDGDSDTDDSTSGLVDYNNAAIGDKVPFVVTSKVPDMTGYEKYYFVFTDTLSKGLTYSNDMAITVGTKTLTADTDYTIEKTENADGTTTLKIIFKNFIQYKDQKGADITLKYSATLNEKAAMGSTANTNKINLTYSNNPNTSDNGDSENPDKPGPNSPVGETPTITTRTYTTYIALKKIDKQTSKRLTGAEFQIEGEKLNIVQVHTYKYTEDANGIYWKLKNGSYTTTAPTDNSDEYESTTTKYIKEDVKKTITTSETVKAAATVGPDGILRFEGLSAGEYTITELKAPDGYNLLDEPIKVTIIWRAPIDGGMKCTWTYTVDGESKEADGNGVLILTVENTTGSVLPETGGMGTTLFYIIGFVLVTGAAVLLITKKRMSVQ